MQNTKPTDNKRRIAARDAAQKQQSTEIEPSFTARQDPMAPAPKPAPFRWPNYCVKKLPAA